MSTLVAQTISNGTVSTSSANVIQGCAKAWVNFNGVTTATIRASYNVSSVTRNSTGNYTINFTNSFADTNYSVSGLGQRSTDANQQLYLFAFNTSSFQVISQAATGGTFDFPTVCMQFFR